MSFAGPRYSRDELWSAMEDADACLLNEDGALNDPGRWLGLVKDLCRSHLTALEDLGIERDRRLHG